MPSVQFYFGASDGLTAAADWLSRQSGDCPAICVLSSGSQLAEQLSRLLWTRSALGFTPHCLSSSPLAQETTIVICTDGMPVAARPCWLNLSGTVPQNLEQCEQLIEFVSQNEQDRAQARDRFRAYRNLGYTVESIDLSQTSP